MNPRALSLLFAAAVFSGCASDGVTLPRMPAWKAPKVERAEFTGEEVRVHAGALAPGAAVDLSDSRFTIVNHETALALLAWTDSVYFSTGQRYTPESFDCDKFAKAYTLAVEWCAARSGVKAQPLAARIYVEQRAAFARIPGSPTATHGAVGIRTDEGYFVIEPQPGSSARLRVAPLADYPNRIYQIKIGG